MKHRILPGLLSTALTLSLCAIPASALEAEDARTLLQAYYVDRDSRGDFGAGLSGRHTGGPGRSLHRIYDGGGVPELPQLGGRRDGGGGRRLRSRTAVDDGVQILSILDNSPAQEAGLSAGDRILAVDGVALTSGMDASSLIRGRRAPPSPSPSASTAPGRSGTLPWSAGGTIPIVTYDLVDGDVGYIDCDSFGASTSDTVQEALEEMGRHADLGGGPALQPWGHRSVRDPHRRPVYQRRYGLHDGPGRAGLLPRHPARRPRPHRRAGGGPHQLPGAPAERRCLPPPSGPTTSASPLASGPTARAWPRWCWMRTPPVTSSGAL